MPVERILARRRFSAVAVTPGIFLVFLPQSIAFVLRSASIVEAGVLTDSVSVEIDLVESQGVPVDATGTTHSAALGLANVTLREVLCPLRPLGGGGGPG